MTEWKTLRNVAIAIVVFVVAQKLITHLPYFAGSDPEVEEPLLSSDRVFAAAIHKQKEFCVSSDVSRNLKFEPMIQLAHANFMGTKFDMLVHARNDTVSDCIHTFGGWEAKETICFYNAITRYMAKKNIKDPASLTVLDIGAQVGWYALGLASKGFRVIAFEPLALNVYMMRKSFCMNPNMPMILVDKALGLNEERCYLYGESHNIGDPALFCGRPSPNPNFVKLEPVDSYRLDDFADMMGNLVAVKLDIEGSEHNVMKSGRRVLIDMHVPIILTEFGADMIREKNGDPRMYLEEYEKAGYKMGVEDFAAPFLTIDEVLNIMKTTSIINLFLIHESAI